MTQAAKVMTQESFLRVTHTPRGVTTLVLNRPEIHNAFNEALIAEITSTFAALAKDDKVRLVILTGAGKSFCAGADLNWMKKMKDFSEAENMEDAKRLADMFHAVNSFPKPVIAKVQGAALGGGTGLVACCDYVVAGDEAVFGLTEVRLGIVSAVISPYVIAKIGESHARALFLSGMKFDAERAFDIGLVHEAVMQDRLDEAVNDVVDEFLQAAPGAAKTAKSLIAEVMRLMREDKTGELKTVRDYACKTIAKARTSPEGQEGMNALLEKRKPKWV